MNGRFIVHSLTQRVSVWCPIGGFRGRGGHGVPSGRSDPDLDEQWHRVCDQESLTEANDILFFRSAVGIFADI